MLLPTHHATLLELLLVTASWAPASGTWSGPCVGPRTFTEARAQWLSEWQHTRPGLAMHNWTTNVPGTIVPPDDVMVEIVVYGIQSIDNVNQVATIDLIHRTSWTDPRLRFRPASEGGCFTNPWSPEGELGYDGTPEGNVWTPGVAVMNDDKPTKPIYSGWWVYPSGSVWWAKKVQLKVKCNFSERLPPLSRLDKDPTTLTVPRASTLAARSTLAIAAGLRRFCEPSVRLAEVPDPVDRLA